jgi:predicted cobalt transporter CbtA
MIKIYIYRNMSPHLFFIFKPIVHYSLHFLAPGLIAYIFFRKEWKKAWLIMIATMLVDADHLLATPIFDPDRCSIGYHPLHSYYAIAVYFVLLFFPKTRIIAVGLLFHMFTDWQDCQWPIWFLH